MQHYGLNIEMEFLENFADQLDTIEEKSQECTPQFELARQHAKEWSKMCAKSFQSKSDELSSICEMHDDINQHINEIKDSFLEINEELNIPNPSSKTIVAKIFKLKVLMQDLQKKLEQCKAEISDTEKENTDLASKIKQLEQIVNGKSENHASEEHTCVII